MLKLSSRAVGAAFFGTVSGLLAGLCFGLRAWWPAGIFLAAAFACVIWSGYAAIMINTVLEKYGVPLEGVHDTEVILEKGRRQRRDFSEGKVRKGGVSPKPVTSRPGPPQGQGGGKPN